MNLIDNFLDRITMYKLLLYLLIVFVIAAFALSFFGVLPFFPFEIVFSVFFLISICWISNRIFASIFKVPTNTESVYITALILALIIAPSFSFQSLLLLGLAGILSMASKYTLAINRKHIFNPAAIAVVITPIIIGQYADWWVGQAWMMPFVILGGLLIVKKIQKEDLLFSFLITAVIAISGFAYFSNGDLIGSLKTIFFQSALFFLAFIMLTEPLTTPPSRVRRILYGILVGIGVAYLTPEVALVLGNIFSYLVSPKQKLLLTLKKKLKIGSDILDFTFNLDKKIDFVPGQYLEWTLAHKSPDSRGNRRYFTIASSPTENNLRLGIKLYPNGSSFKKALTDLKQKTRLIGSQLAGEFILPKGVSRKLVFIAGGIGITPFRSMIKYLLDKGEKRDIILLYSNKSASEIMYADVWNQAFSNLGIKTVYALTEQTPADWMGRKGRIDAKMIAEEVPDWKERLFYLSGPHVMVSGFEQVLKSMGVSSNQIKIDFFPGFV